MEDGSNRKARLVLHTACAVLFALAFVSLTIDRCSAAFLGLNGRIAYSYSDAAGDSIGSADADGGAPLRLTAGGEDSGPIYSPDGGRIAFERDRGIALMNADGS